MKTPREDYVIVALPEHGGEARYFSGTWDRPDWVSHPARAVTITKGVSSAVAAAGMVMRSTGLRCIPVAVEDLPALQRAFDPDSLFILREWPMRGDRYKAADARLAELRASNYVVRCIGNVTRHDGVVIGEHFYCVPRRPRKVSR